MVKVCHMTSAHTRHDGRIFDKECRSLAKNGYDVYLVVNDNKENEEIDGVKIVSTGYVAKSRIDRMKNSTKMIYKKALEIDADVYHFHDPELLPVGKKLKKKGKKVIFDSHECYYMQIKEKPYIPKPLRGIISKAYYTYETNICKKIDAVVIPCTIDNENFFEGRAKKVATIENYSIFNEKYSSGWDASRSNAVCYTGALTYSRGIYHLIKACYKCGAKLILAGSIQAEFKKQIMSMPEFSIVDFRGYLSKDEVYKIYNDCSVGICTLLNLGQYDKSDNLSNKVYEYMAMSMPVILNDYPYANKLLKKYKYGILVDPENIDELAEKIDYLLKHKDVAKSMGESGYKAIKNELNWDIAEKELLKLYKQI